jgi:hypothetical protein
MNAGTTFSLEGEDCEEAGILGQRTGLSVG